MVLCLFREGEMFRHELIKQFLKLVGHAYVVLGSWGHCIWVEISNKSGLKGWEKVGKGKMPLWQGGGWDSVAERQKKEQGPWERERLWRGYNQWAGSKRAKRKGSCLSISSCFLHFWYLAVKYLADIMTGQSIQLTHGSLWLVTKGLCLHFFWKVSL